MAALFIDAAVVRGTGCVLAFQMFFTSCKAGRTRCGESINNRPYEACREKVGAVTSSKAKE